MTVANPNLTRRQLLRSAGIGAAGLDTRGRLGEIASGALAHREPRAAQATEMAHPAGSAHPVADGHPQRAGRLTDPIFIAPYNSPVGQAGAVIVDNSGQPIWENPLAGKVTTNFRVQRYRGSPVLTWWEGSIELGHGVGEYVIADSELPHGAPCAGGARTARRPARVRDHPARHRAADELRGHEGRPLLRRRPAQRHDPGRDLPGDRPRQRQAAARVAQPRSHAAGGVLRAGGTRTGTSSTSTRSTSTATATCSSPRAARTPSTSSTAAGRSCGASAASTATSRWAPGSNFAWQHDARRQPDGTLTDLRQRRHPGGGEALARPDPRPRRAGDDRDPRCTNTPTRGSSPAARAACSCWRTGTCSSAGEKRPTSRSSIARARMLFDADARREATSPTGRSACPGAAVPPKLPRSRWPATAATVTAYASWNGATEVSQLAAARGRQSSSATCVASTRSRGFESALRRPSQPASIRGPGARRRRRAARAVEHDRGVADAGIHMGPPGLEPAQDRNRRRIGTSSGRPTARPYARPKFPTCSSSLHIIMGPPGLEPAQDRLRPGGRLRGLMPGRSFRPAQLTTHNHGPAWTRTRDQPIMSRLL